MAAMRRSFRFVAVVVGATQVLSGCVVAGGYSSNDGGSGFFFLLPLLMFVFIAYAITRMGRQRGRSRSSGGQEQVNPQMTRAELSVLADDVLRLEPQIALHPEAREDFDAATHRYRVAQAAIDHAQTADDLLRVRRVVDEASWSMSRARALIDGRPLPAPPPQLQRPGPRGEPAVAVDDRDAPTYVGSPAPFRSGWFGGGLLGGMFFGPLMGGFGGWVLDDDQDDGGDYSDYDDRPE
jgi:hypothetical protein